ncbi:MAG: hypothetical protein K0Q68_2454 [Moraxellaceae bacterium]|jgi:SAM-dependent methyltransferase|nr:hypothetical protein [Moraxellaceae bacterium]
MDFMRRNILQAMAGLLVLGSAPVLAQALEKQQQNFRYIYRTPALRRAFSEFLRNVFHLYPAADFDALIARCVARGANDQQIYGECQKGLEGISPFLADLRLALPALVKQRQVMTGQTLRLLGTQRRFDGYLEFGSSGRYLDALEEVLQLEGPRYFVHEREPGYSPVDIIDRGQIRQAGSTFLLNQYQPGLAGRIAPASLDLVTVYIGFHHCPVPLREAFLQDIRQVMRPGAWLVVRDHQVNSQDMWHLVALAHDVFNMGTQETWAYNDAERRHFYSLEFLDGLLQKNGFKGDGRRLYQAGDPTHNALMVYRKA